MSNVVQAVRGMNDILPGQTAYWQHLEKILCAVVQAYGYQEIRFPIIEQTSLFKRTIGEVTDIVEKEMYTFEDRNGDSVTLRPEGTAGCTRAGIENNLFYGQAPRLWYLGPMFRHERPQKGRYRQFYQFGVEAYGVEGPDIDAEQILMVARILDALQLRDKVTLEINSLGTTETRHRYREALVAFFAEHHAHLDEDSRRRLKTNPLRILDSKSPQMQALIEQAPKLTDFLDEASQKHFDGFRRLLDIASVKYKINARLVRGLDYYGKTVYEWVTQALGAQGTVCAGGRYDALVEQLGGKAVPAVGFALGLERLISLMESHYTPSHHPHAYLVMVGDSCFGRGLVLAERLRSALPELRLMMHTGGGSFKSQFKKADKSGAQLALLLADDELANNTVTVKFLREQKEQQVIPQEKLVEFFEKSLGDKHGGHLCIRSGAA